MTAFRSGRRGWLLSALVVGLVLVPAGQALAGPGWDHERLPPLTLGMEHVHEPSSVLYRGETLVAVTVGEREIVVRRLDRSVQRWPAFLPVGGPIARRLSNRVTQPVLHVGADDRLYIAWFEWGPGRGDPHVVTARLHEEPDHRAQWEILGGDEMVVWGWDAPSLVDVGDQLWLVYRSSHDQIRLARLFARGSGAPEWRLSSAIENESLNTFGGAAAYGGSIYVLSQVDESFEVFPGDDEASSDDDEHDAAPNEVDDSGRDSHTYNYVGLEVYRLDVADDRDRRPVIVAERRPSDFRILEDDLAIAGARIATGAGGRPVLTWDADGPLHLEELSPDGGRFVELRAIPLDVSGEVVISAGADEIIVGVPTFDDEGTARRGGLRVLRIPRDPAQPIDAGPLLAIDDAANMTLSIRPDGAAFVIVPQDNRLSSHLLTHDASGPDPDGQGPAPAPSRRRSQEGRQP